MAFLQSVFCAFVLLHSIHSNLAVLTRIYMLGECGRTETLDIDDSYQLRILGNEFNAEEKSCAMTFRTPPTSRKVKDYVYYKIQNCTITAMDVRLTITRKSKSAKYEDIFNYTNSPRLDRQFSSREDLQVSVSRRNGHSSSDFLIYIHISRKRDTESTQTSALKSIVGYVILALIIVGCAASGCCKIGLRRRRCRCPDCSCPECSCSECSHRHCSCPGNGCPACSRPNIDCFTVRCFSCFGRDTQQAGGTVDQTPFRRSPQTTTRYSADDPPSYDASVATPQPSYRDVIPAASTAGRTSNNASSRELYLSTTDQYVGGDSDSPMSEASSVAAEDLRIILGQSSRYPASPEIVLSAFNLVNQASSLSPILNARDDRDREAYNSRSSEYGAADYRHGRLDEARFSSQDSADDPPSYVSCVASLPPSYREVIQAANRSTADTSYA